MYVEMKILWFFDKKNNSGSFVSVDFYDYLLRKKVLEDSWRLRKNLYKNNSEKEVKKSLSLICISDSDLKDCNEIRRNISGAINTYFENEIITDIEEQILIDNIGCNMNRVHIIPNEKDYKYFLYLISVNM